jgi:hypothetical protein
MDEGSWDAVCRQAKAGRNTYLLNHGLDIEVVNPPPIFSDELSMIFTRLSLAVAHQDPPQTIGTAGPLSAWENPLLVSGYTNGPIEEELGELWDKVMGGGAKTFEELEEMEKEDR